MIYEPVHCEFIVDKNLLLNNNLIVRDKFCFVDNNNNNKIEEELNISKRKLNKYSNNDYNKILKNNFDSLLLVKYLLENNYRKNKYISKKYKFYFNPFLYQKNAEFVSNAWLKCFELIVKHDLLNQNNPIKTRKNIFFNAELPGSFILAINHYCKTNLINYDWLANSLVDNNMYCLKDDYGLFKKYREKWIMNDNMNGDITNIDNIYKIMEFINSRWDGDDSNERVDIYFSDGGVNVYELGEKYFGKKDNGYYDEHQEQLNTFLNFSQIIFGLLILKKEGNFITKQYTFFKNINIELIMLLSNLFESFKIVKPASSRQFNSEIYLIGKNFLGLSEEIKQKLINLLKQKSTIYSIDFCNYSFLDINYINRENDYLSSISKKIFIDIQAKNLNNMVLLAELLNNDIYKIFQNNKEKHIEFSKNFINLLNILPLKNKDKLL